MRITRKALRRLISESVVPLFQNRSVGKLEIYYQGPDVGYGDYVRGPESKGLSIQIHAEGEDTPLPSNLIGYQGNDVYGNLTQYNIDPSLGIEDKNKKLPMKVVYDSSEFEVGDIPTWEDIPRILKDTTGVIIPEDWLDAAGEKLDTYADELESQIEEDPDNEGADSPIMVLIRMIDGTWHSHIM